MSGEVLMVEADFSLEHAAFTLSVKERLRLEGITAIFGPSGSGKTSLLRVLAGLEPRARGTLYVGGACWMGPGRAVPPHRRGLGMVFQDMCLFDHMSVADNLRYGQRRRGRSPAVIDAADVIRVLDLGHLLTRSPAALSGGERQRAALGRCLMSDPRLLLLDEPLAALDAARIEQIVPYLRRVAWEFARPMFLVSHSVSEVRRLAERVLTIDAGRITGSYAINDQRWRRGRGRRGAELVGRVLSATGGSSLVDVDGQGLRVRGVWPVASQLMLRYDPSAVILSATPPATLAALTWLEGTLQLTSTGDASDGLTRVNVTAGRVTIEALTGADALREAGLSEGSRVWAILADGGILTESISAGKL